MSSVNQTYTGIWLHQGERRGQSFSHTEAYYEHPTNEPGDAQPAGAPSPMKHVFIDQNGSQVGVWVPQGWSQDEARAALDSNW